MSETSRPEIPEIKAAEKNPEFSNLVELINEKSSQQQKSSAETLTIINEIKQENTDIKSRIASLENEFKNKIRFDEVKEKQFEVMMNELERYKSNFIFNAVQKRLFMEIIEISDKVADIMKVANAEGSKEDLIKHIESLRKQFDQLFINQGIERIVSKSDLFDGQVQEATDAVSTNVKEENQKVVEVLKEGYRFDQKLIRPQKVVVKKYTN